MSYDFPNSPVVGQVYQGYTWDGTVWRLSSPSLGAADHIESPAYNMWAGFKATAAFVVNDKQDSSGNDLLRLNNNGRIDLRGVTGSAVIYGGSLSSTLTAHALVVAAVSADGATPGAGFNLYGYDNTSRPGGIDFVVSSATGVQSVGGYMDRAGTLTATRLIANGNITAAQDFISSTAAAILNTTGAGTIYLRPNGVGSGTGQVTVGSGGDLTVTGGFTYAGIGLRCRAGAAGGYGGSGFNTNWGGSALAVWVDSTNIGNMTVSSDYRIKKDVVDLPGMWDTVKALRPISYTQAAYDIMEADNKPRWGFIAHELQQTMIMDAATGFKDVPDMIQSPNPWTIIAALNKALQEAMQRIEALEAKP